ncbi:MAG: hypothetical protein WKF84_13750 [Pyrinomonadaceae bacterium]
MAEVYEPRLEEGAAIERSHGARGYKDFRQMLDNKDSRRRGDVDARSPARSDDHRLAPPASDVYVEKPLTHAVREGQWMIEAARHYKRVVQVGTQQRSGVHYQKVRQNSFAAGTYGEVRNARIASFRNIMPGFTAPVWDRAAL